MPLIQTMVSKSATFLKAVIAIPTVISVLFGIYQLVIMQWVTGALWLAAGLVGFTAMCAQSGKMSVAILTVYVLLLFAAFICHIVFLSIIGLTQNQVSSQSAGVQESVSRTFNGNIQDVTKTTHIVGIVGSIVFILLGFPLYLLLASRLRRYRKRKFDTYPHQNVENSDEPMVSSYGNQGQYQQASSESTTQFQGDEPGTTLPQYAAATGETPYQQQQMAFPQTSGTQQMPVPQSVPQNYIPQQTSTGQYPLQGATNSGQQMPLQ